MATKEQCKNFIETIAPRMMEEAKKRGYKIVSTAIAQAACESAWGTSWLSKFPYYNFFGIKVGNSKGRAVNAQTKECYDGQTYVTINDDFRAYPRNFETTDVRLALREGISDYYDLIDCERYNKVKNSMTFEQYAKELKNCGYATAPTYPDTLMNIVINFNLTKYDELLNTDKDYDFRAYFPIYRGDSISIVDILNSYQSNSSYAYREKIALKNNIQNYTGTAQQNLKLVTLAKAGLLVIP